MYKSFYSEYNLTRINNTDTFYVIPLFESMVDIKIKKYFKCLTLNNNKIFYVICYVIKI